MAQPRRSGAGDCRRWAFAGCVFDEANWTLTVDGARVAIESKPLKVLRELLLRPGEVVSKGELLDSIWPDVTVVEASLPTAVRKLRQALGDDRRERRVIETVSAIGYRFAAQVEVEALPEDPATASEPGAAAGGRLAPGKAISGRLLAVLGALAIASAAIAFALSSPERRATKTVKTFTRSEQLTALRKLDITAVEQMLEAGWNPDSPMDKEGNSALNIVLNICEWDPDHDQRQMLLMARTLIDGGVRFDRRNAWGDTAYSIAKAKRYCGPDHPVTKMIRTMCNSGFRPLGDRCLASYEIKRRARSRIVAPI